MTNAMHNNDRQLIYEGRVNATWMSSQIKFKAYVNVILFFSLNDSVG